jgi:4-hydroxyproline epimerase
MCGHGTIGTVTMALERGLVTPREPGLLRIDTPAGLVEARYVQNGDYVDSVRLTNVPAFLHSTGLTAEVEGLGEIVADVSYGGNFYAIIEPQKNYPGLEHVNPSDILRWSPKVRAAFRAKYEFVHPENPAINGLSHVLWTGTPTHPEAHAKNAVFYGDKAIDRSPCGTGTSARMAQWAAQGKLKAGDDFVHESIIGTLFKGRVEKAVKLGNRDGIVPSIEGWARMTGYNTIFIDDRDPLAHGFQVKDRD